MTIRYACCGLIISARRPYSKGKSAPPRLPMMSNDDPMRVKRPRPSIASGHTAGQISEFAIPSKAMKTTDINLGDAIAETVRIIPRMAQRKL